MNLKVKHDIRKDVPIFKHCNTHSVHPPCSSLVYQEEEHCTPCVSAGVSS